MTTEKIAYELAGQLSQHNLTLSDTRKVLAKLNTLFKPIPLVNERSQICLTCGMRSDCKGNIKNCPAEGIF